jgi:actin-like ATPase involved in cell morphogenesis
MAYRIGVDLGTTSVAAAVCDAAGVRMVALGDRTPETPTAVYLHSDGTWVTGRRAASRSVTSPGRVARGFLRRVGDPEPVIVGGEPFPVPGLVGVLLAHIVARVSEVMDGPPDIAVLTHPVSWEAAHVAVLAEAAERAGLANSTLVSAPEAVAANWATGQTGGDASVAVYDLGGGTFDAAVLRVTDGRPRLVGTPTGLRLGGTDFDEALFGFVDAAVDGTLSGLDRADPANATVLARVRQDCVRAKEALTGVPEAFVPVFLPERHSDVRVRLADLEELITERVEATADALAATIDSAGVGVDELSAVLLVGGSARIPLVTQAVSQRLGTNVAPDETLSHPVAMGAATLAGQLAEAAAAGSRSRWRVGAVGPKADRIRADGAGPGAGRTGAAHAASTARPATVTPAVAPAASGAATRHALSPRPGRNRWTVLVAGVVVAALLVGGLLAVFLPRSTPTLELTTDAVAIGDSYLATATGFVPGEPVELSWTGPTNGVMGTAPADASGVRRHGPILERDPPGSYQIIATGHTSGRTVSVPLQVLPPR